MQLNNTTVQLLKKEIAQRKILIFGLGAEGLSSYHFLRKHLPNEQILLTDDKAVELLGKDWESILETDKKLTFMPIQEVGQNLSGELWVLKTPGIPFTHPLCAQLEGKDILYSSNTELFFAILAELPSSVRPQTIGITGTKGKSTTTAMIYHVLKTAGMSVFLAGNIGVPALDTLMEIENLPEEKLSRAIAVLELSSHQLQTLPYSPHIAVVQNITPEHLDYYQDFEEYWQAKSAITKHQAADDIVIYNPSFEIPSEFAAFSAAQKYPYSLDEHPSGVAHYKNGWIYSKDNKIIETKELPLMGEHNILNTLPAVVIAEIYGISVDVLQSALKTFKSLPHRLEFVTEKSGVRFYNDSQATTPEAAIAAIRSFPGSNIILLAGGSDKGVSFEAFAEEIVAQQIPHVILFPPMGEKIASDIKRTAGLTGSLPQFHPVKNMSEAVTIAAQLAKKGDIVLLSPACASFGLFKNYQDRGNQFKAAAQAL